MVLPLNPTPSTLNSSRLVKSSQVSFPGIYSEEWDRAVAAADGEQICSLACVFLTDTSSGLGQHAENPDSPGRGCRQLGIRFRESLSKGIGVGGPKGRAAVRFLQMPRRVLLQSPLWHYSRRGICERTGRVRWYREAAAGF